MENNNENINSSNDEQNGADLDNLEPSALKDLLIKERQEKQKVISERNQNFERLKKEQGYEKQDDGSWVKTEKVVEKKVKKDTDEIGLIEKTYLRIAGVMEEDEIELAKDVQKKTGLEWDKLVDDDYFKSKLENLRTKKANELATSGVKAGGGNSETKNSPEYWLAKGVPPTPEQVPDKKTRTAITRAFMASAKSGKKFYND